MTYLFDIGNVLLAFDFTPALSTLLGRQADPNALQQIIARKDDFEAGQIDVDEYISWASTLLDYRGGADGFKQAWRSIFTPIYPNWELVKQLHAEGHRLILYSNTNAIHAPYCMEQYDIFRYFDHAVFSHEIGEIKPHCDFFTRSFELFDINPAETRYIDDLEDNILAGRRHGLDCFHYLPDSHQALAQWTKK